MRVLADGRVQRTEAEWRGLVDRFEKSGLSTTAFCARAKLPRSSFVKWRGILGQSPAVERSSRRSPAFVEWVAPASAQAESAKERGELELTLPGGVVVRWKA
jgi:hypothetical protein